MTKHIWKYGGHRQISDEEMTRMNAAFDPDEITELTEIYNEPRTITERLDAAQNGEQFGNVILDLFAGLERARDDE